MAERGSTGPASTGSAGVNATRIAREMGISLKDAMDITKNLRLELKAKDIKGFKRGGTVRKTGVYKLHKGERVAKASTARRSASRRPAKRR